MYRVTLCGSFHRHLHGFADQIREFDELGCEILSPRDVRIVDEIGEFLFVAGDPYRSIKLVENRHLFAIGASDFVWLTSSDGYVGLSAALEIGFAVAKGKKVYSNYSPSDLTLAEYVTVVLSPKEALRLHIVLQRERNIQRDMNILLDPVYITERAHSLIDRIGHLLSRPAVLPAKLLEQEIGSLIRQVHKLYQLPIT